MTLANLFRRHSRPRHRAATRNPVRRRCQLGIEALEARVVPSTLTVTSAADDGSAGTLRAVLAASASGDTIRFAAPLSGHTITLTQGQLEINHNLSIVGLGSSLLAVSGNAASRVLDIDPGVTAAVSDLTLTGGLATDGGAVLNAGSLTLARAVLTGNVAQGAPGGVVYGDGTARGGAVENLAGATLTVSDSTVSGNQANAATDSNISASGIGGGIDNNGGTLVVVRSVLSGNQAVGGPGGKLIGTYYGITFAYGGGVGEGGAISSTNGTLTLTNSTLSNNTARGGPAGSPPPGAVAFGGTGQGAAISSTNETLSVTNCTLANNTAVGGSAGSPPPGALTAAGGALGGGIWSFGDSVTLTGSMVSGNSGGGADVQNGPSATISNTTFLNNQGGGVGIGNIPFQMSNCLISGNVSSGVSVGGGGMSVGEGSPGAISNTTFIGNVAEGSDGGEAVGGGLEVALFTQSTGATLSLTNCTFSGNIARAAAGAFITDAEGGGVFISGTSTVTANNCTFTGNAATMAQGVGQGHFISFALGGGIDVDFHSSLTLTNSIVSGNQVIGEPGAAGGVGGTAEGGGITVDGGSSLILNNSVISGNLVRGGVGGADAAGGIGAGGAIAVTNSASTVTVTNSVLAANLAQGGQGGSGGNGGNGEGGGLFLGVGTTGTLHSSMVVANLATGGAAGSGGTAGQGVGGGAYNLSTLYIDALSIIFANFASTSDNDVFGPITPI